MFRFDKLRDSQLFTVVHTADWHLGQSFFGYDRDYEHSRFLEWLLQDLITAKPDALIVSGDVFDSINPSALSQKRYFTFLASTHAALPQMQIVITAGNHDAGARLEAPAGLLESMNITVVGTVLRNDQGQIDLHRFLIPLKDTQNVVRAIVLAVPFLRPSDVPFVSGAVDPYLDGIRELYGQLTEAARDLKTHQFPHAAIIAMGHCHMQDAAESRDSERRIVIGGAEAVRPDIFDSDIAYVALGHLHKAQELDCGRIRYSGSPIPLSFAEVQYSHCCCRLTFSGSQLHSVEEVQIPRSVTMLNVPPRGAAAIDEVLLMLQEISGDPTLTPEQYPFLEVRVLEDGPDPARRKRIEQALEGRPLRLASIKLERLKRDFEADSMRPAADSVDLKSISPEVVFLDAWREKFGAEPDPELLAAFREILLMEDQES